ncbi:MAG: carbon-monoxide dehydrogenase catalytic subunit [Spirochaetes bacterium RBG_16_49_21]|nr:MAG: carbon-monoxide dehydrogenase catalytic subunit [Spirochaetes bacterium RBG_16_49_21]
MPEEKKHYSDKASIEAYENAKKDNILTVYDRAEDLRPCPIGSVGDCCKHCGMGPCRIPAPKKEGEKRKAGLCGATAETIAARNFLRMIAAGSASHSDHGRSVAEIFLAAAKGEIPGYKIKDEQKLLALALDFGINIDGKDMKTIAIEVGEKSIAQFGQQHGELLYIKKAPEKRQEIWRKMGVVPRGIDREVVEIMHRTHMGVDQDYKSLMKQGTRAALADGWGGSMLATDLQDIMFGTPVPVYAEVNLGVLKKDQVNIVIHGHEPLLSEMIVVASQDPEIKKYAVAKGATGINIAGICCTANEILMRHGIPIAGNFLQQELAITTGAIDAMVVDVQCVMQALQNVASCFHTKLITTSHQAGITGATAIPFNEHDALNSAKAILKTGIDNFPNRKNVAIPDIKSPMIAGFSHETINYLLGGSFRASYRPLNDNIINGRIRGIAGVVGCNNARTTCDTNHLTLVKELIKNDVIVLTTGCSAIGCGKEGLLTPEAAMEFAGPGLREVCETVGIPPVLHMGACVDNSRILIAATAVVKEGGLGNDISDLPAAGAAPEWMSEKAIAIGQYFVASGVYTIFGGSAFPTTGSPEFTKYLFEDMEKIYGGKWDYTNDPVEMARKMIEHIDKKRKELGIDKAKGRVLFDMADRRELA